MKKVGKTIVVTLLFVVFWSVAGELHATSRRPIRPTYCDIEPVSYDKSTGHLILELRINFAHYDGRFTTCGVVTVRVSGVDGLEYSGPEQWEVPSDTLAPASLTRLEATAPPNDTSGLIVTMECGEYQSNYPTYFITTADTLWAVGSNPREWPKMPTEEENRQNRLKDYERAKREWEERQEQLRRFKGKSTTGHGPRLSPEDSVIFNTLSEKGQRRFVRMRNLERTPLTEQDRQIISLDGAIYVRHRGETKFHREKSTTDPIAHSRQRMDSVQISLNKAYDITIDLKEPDDFELVKQLVDTLMPTEQQGFFRAVAGSLTACCEPISVVF